ncbi:MAG: DEAD/DEAH box helicase family protein [Gemmataceae bacterium]|nr:DEAD/DEAH box helicase family protein [Gemmataceae bacterium]
MAMSSPKVVPSDRLSLKDRLSRLTFLDACKLLGAQGKQLIQSNANTWTIDIADDVHLGDDLLRVRLAATPGHAPAIVTITLMAAARQRLHYRCDQCEMACDHVGAVFSLILEEKTALGLAAPPPERQPVASIAEDDLVERALLDRQQRARDEKMTVKSADASQAWTDYTVTNRLSGKTYRVTLRGFEPGDSFCSCPDYRTNTLGTCKHLMKVAAFVKRKFPADRLRRRFRPRELAVHLHYAGEVTLRLLVPDRLDDATAAVVAPLRDKAIGDLPDLLKRLAKLQKSGRDVVIHPDAEEFIQQRMDQTRLQAATAEIRRDPNGHPLRTTLLKAPLLPYQLDGIAFAAGAGRAILADEMGLGKTIQGVGAAEFLAREAGIRKVLVICPASLKSQWRNEIHKFCERDVQLIAGAVAERASQYGNDCFFTVCNYEQVIRDLIAIERTAWDLIILDEGQRIKNWESKTSRIVKCLRSKFALVLTGTPLENRLDDLYSVVQFVDDRRLGPGFRFFNRHRMLDEKGKVLGYKNLGELREVLKPILLRRTRESVRLELPPRSMEIVRVTPTQEQLTAHAGHMQIVASITHKKFITEMDLLRLQKALLMCRMLADSTFLADKLPPGYSSKLARLDELLEQLFEEPGRKVVLFSEWTTMLDLIEPLIRKRGVEFVRLDGSVPQKQREELVHRFQTKPACAMFLTTNAGSVGLNLQAANTVINVDLPWNPAVLEQRIARAHRMGQTQSVQVFVLVTEQTIEENLLATIAAKKELALAALDVESDIEEVQLQSGLQELKSRLEILLGSVPESPKHEAQRERVEQSIQEDVDARRERIGAAGGELFGAVIRLLGELTTESTAAPPPEALVATLRNSLEACVDGEDRPRLTITLPSKASLDQLSQSLAQLMMVSGARMPLGASATMQEAGRDETVGEQRTQVANGEGARK